jgi:hypothetical protein
MIPIRTISLLAYFTYIFIDIIIYALWSMPWSSRIFWTVGRVITDPSCSFQVHAGWYPGYQSLSLADRLDEATG